MISMIAAMDKNRVIGKNQKLPWNIPEDFKWFKSQTINKTVLMGRKTYESIGKPLKDRINIILTNDKSYHANSEIIVYNDIQTVLKNHNDFFVIGGQQIYEQFLQYTNKLYLTIVDNAFEGDTFFPQINETDWSCTYIQDGKDNEPYKYTFNIFEKKNGK